MILLRKTLTFTICEQRVIVDDLSLKGLLNSNEICICFVLRTPLDFYRAFPFVYLLTTVSDMFFPIVLSSFVYSE